MVPDPLQLVVFTLDKHRYALHLSVVERAVAMIEITPLPSAPDIVTGIVNIHGAIVPVLDIRKRFRLPEREPDPGDQLLIAHSAKRDVALAVDAVHDVLAIPAGEVVAPENILPHLEHVDGIVRLDDGLVFIQDLDAFLSLEEEQALEAAIAEESR
jgi:purine-binding chemotaxis protein CheW